MAGKAVTFPTVAELQAANLRAMGDEALDREHAAADPKHECYGALLAAEYRRRRRAVPERRKRKRDGK